MTVEIHMLTLTIGTQFQECCISDYVMMANENHTWRMCCMFRIYTINIV